MKSIPDYQNEHNFAKQKVVHTFYSNFQRHCFPNVEGSGNREDEYVLS
jgi:hypothetical protein